MAEARETINIRSEHNTPSKGQGTITIVFIGGFLTPNGWKCHPTSYEERGNIEIINVYPSPVGSIHDRVCEIFYELMGGKVFYGHEHSQHHGHSAHGKEFTQGKHSQWNEDHPIYLVGHSYGGVTARALQTYLAETRFPGYQTNENWVAGIIMVNSPLNGALMTYLLGAHAYFPPIVTWGSVGYFLSNFVHLSALCELDDTLSFQFGHWKLSYRSPSSFSKLCDSILGVTVGSNTDNAAYDMTIQSQCRWAQYLPTYCNTFYLSIVGRISPKIGQVLPPEDVSNSLWSRCIQALYSNSIQLFFYLISVKEMKISNIDCSHWFYYGWDGLVSCYSQLKPSLPSPHHHPSDQSIPVTNSILQDMRPGIWHSWELPNDHLRVAMCCSQSWELIWHAVEQMHSSNRPLQEPLKSNTAALPMAQLPDIQSVPIDQLNRDQIAYPITLMERFFGMATVIIGLAIVLGDEHLFERFQSILLSSSLLTFTIGNWIIHSPPYSFYSAPGSSSGSDPVKWNPQKFSPFLRSEVWMMSANLIRFLSFLCLFHFLSSETVVHSIMTVLILTRSLEIASLCALCPHLQEHSSIIQLSVSLLVFCCWESSLLDYSIPHLLTFFLLKELLHLLSRLGWIINSQQQQQQRLWWGALWVPYLVLSCCHLGLLFSCLSMTPWTLLLGFLWEWIGSMREISLAYQVFSLMSSSSSSVSSSTSASFLQPH